MARIVILGSAYPLRGGGLATFNERLARAFIEAGHEVIIYTFSLQYPKVFFPGKSQYSEDEAPAGLDIRVRVNSINPLNWQRVGHELRNMKPDLLVIRYWLPFMAPCLGRIAEITKQNNHTRIVAIADNVIPHEKRPGDTLLTRYFIKKPHAFICMSDSVKRDLEQFAVPAHNIRLCLHPLYDNFGEAIDKKQACGMLELESCGYLVLFFGFIREYKGLDLLLKAFSHEKIKQLPVRLLVAGEFYADGDQYYQLAKELNVNEKVFWHTHFIPNDKVKAYFCAADLVAQPYKHATQSGVTQVAYHFEKPMLVTDVGGLPEMVPHGKVGYVVQTQVESIADAIADFFINNKAIAMKQALKLEKKRFSWDRLIESIFQISGHQHYINDIP